MQEPDVAAGTGELRGLAAALRAGRVRPPLSELALSRYLGPGGDQAVRDLTPLLEDGLAPAHLAAFLDLLAAERSRWRVDVDSMVELVSSGPEATANPARDTRVVVRELFRKADKSVLVAGYAVHQGRNVFEVLAERMAERPGIRVRMFLDVQRRHGDTSSSLEIVRQFSDRFRKNEWPGEQLPEVYYDPRSLEPEASKRTSLHAKCLVVDENVAFVSSANFTEAAQLRNIEIGVLVRSAPFARQLSLHFLTLAERHALVRLPGT